MNMLLSSELGNIYEIIKKVYVYLFTFENSDKFVSNRLKASSRITENLDFF